MDFLVAPRRHVLDTIVAQAPWEAGATLRLGVTVTGLRRDAAGRVTGVSGHDLGGEPVGIDAAVVVGAAACAPRSPGTWSSWRGGGPGAQRDRLVRLPPGARVAGDGGLRQRGRPGGRVPHPPGARPASRRCVPAATASAARRAAGSVPAGFDRLLDQYAPALAERLRASERTSPVRGASRLPNQVRRAWGPGWALVGDALYHRDPITGHGITDAYRDAELLAEARWTRA